VLTLEYDNVKNEPVYTSYHITVFTYLVTRTAVKTALDKNK